MPQFICEVSSPIVFLNGFSCYLFIITNCSSLFDLKRIKITIKQTLPICTENGCLQQ